VIKGDDLKRKLAAFDALGIAGADYPPGDGLAAGIRSFDWSRTPLGPIQGWPQSLKTVTSMLLLSPVPIVLLWGEKGIMIYNDAYSVFAGGRHPRLLGSEVRQGWPEVADFNDHVMKVGLAGGTLSYKNQELELHRSGVPERVWMNLDYSPVLDESGCPAGVIAIVVETTEHVLAERQVRDAEARLRFLDFLGKSTADSADADTILAVTTRLLGEHMGVSICAYADMDREGDGFTIRGDWSAQGSASIVGHYSLADFGELAVSRLNSGRPLIVNDNRRELPAEAAATFQSIGIAATICMPLVRDGRLTALMAVHDREAREWTNSELALVTEVTERSWAHIQRARSESEVRLGEQRFRQKLEQEVAERTAALRQAEKALLQSQKMEAIGNLTGGIAHDFNNLLTVVLGSLDLLRRRVPDDPRIVRLVDNATEGAKRGSALTTRMLAFARRQDLRSEVIRLHDLLSGMSNLMERSLGPSILVRIEVPPAVRPVVADPNQLESALLNLAVNARDAMDGSGEIIIRAVNDDDPPARTGLACGRYVCLSMTDTGHGMDDSVLGKATEPFFTTKGVGKGTGLGLSMVHGFAQQSGGALALQSSPDRGTTVEIWLPAADAEPVQPGELHDSRSDTAEKVGLSILVVDDDAMVLASTVAMLEDLGHRIRAVPSAEQGLSVLGQGSFDLVITDHAMPGMSGAQFAIAIRNTYPDLPVLLVTGYAELEQERLGDLPRLNKPYSRDDLQKAVAAAIGQ
jgi:signal transduction histidine kinase/CheY-like chemotaxis protein